MDLTLHLGAHRTGSATLAHIMARNADRLAAAGAAVWGPKRLRDAGAESLFGPDGRRAAGRLRIGMALLARSGTRRLVISDAGLLGGLGGNLAEATLYPAAGPRACRIAALAAAHPLRIVLTIRSYEGYWASALAMSLAHGARLPDDGHLDRIVTQPRRWQRIVEDVAAAVPQAEIRVTRFEAVRGEPEAHLAVLDDARLAAVPLRDRDAHAGAEPGRAALRAVLEDRGLTPAAAMDAIGGGEGHWQPFSGAHRETLRAVYAEDLAWLRDGAAGLATLDDGAAPRPSP